MWLTEKINWLFKQNITQYLRGLLFTCTGFNIFVNML